MANQIQKAILEAIGSDQTNWRDEKTGELIFVVCRAGLFDHRKKAPFFQILPCPFCGVNEDKGHDPIAHTKEAIVVG